MLTDTHCHLYFNKFDEDRDAVIQRASEVGVEKILIPALELESSKAVIQLAGSHPNLFAAVGFHPTDLDHWDGTSVKNLLQLAQSTDKVVAIGEIGLDYYWVKEPDKQAKQREALKQQLRLAQQVNKPVIIHMREANDAWLGQASVDLLAILTEWQQGLQAQDHLLAKKPGVLHSFNGTLETAQTAIRHNFYIGVTGPVTYKNADEKRRIIRQLPLERLLIETDAPFLTPVPHRGKRNEPAFVAHIADKIAEIHMTTREQVAEITSGNANTLFGWGG
ncbi:MAG: hydrolase TatD [Anaerolineales bacterium]|nr:TatD family deoxyribonuclease [Anaerolineae bacterium]PWB71717.1 MAG: hydrolase TatD [Anaerolineales bacterium]